MASNTPPAEGVFAIRKPPGLSSAQVIRDAQAVFKDSDLFRPGLEKEKQRLEELSHNQKQKRRSWKAKQAQQVKMGHGGTLDPMATGVLILGVGNGTKSLNTFLECTKSYETTVLFGAATDTYDAVGKIVARKGYSHLTREIVENALNKFRGKIMQKPSIFSALKVNGKKMYEYAREGKELPIEIEARPVEVKELEMLEWIEGGKHDFHWPTEEAPQQEKAAVEKVLKLGDNGADTGGGAKRKRETDDEPAESDQPEGISPSPKRVRSSPEPTASGALPVDASISGATTATKPTSGPDQASSEAAAPSPCPAPACRLRMTVTSGFYVRSLAHDLGAAVGSLGLMSSLVRTRQGDFALAQNVLDYEDLGHGEAVWGPKVRRMLEEWQSKEAERNDGERTKAQDARKSSRGGGRGGGGGGGGGRRGGGKPFDERKKRANSPKKRRRNSSSPESGGDGGLAFLGMDGGDGIF